MVAVSCPLASSVGSSFVLQSFFKDGSICWAPVLIPGSDIHVIGPMTWCAVLIACVLCLVAGCPALLWLGLMFCSCSTAAVMLCLEQFRAGAVSWGGLSGHLFPLLIYF